LPAKVVALVWSHAIRAGVLPEGDAPTSSAPTRLTVTATAVSLFLVVLMENGNMHGLLHFNLIAWNQWEHLRLERTFREHFGLPAEVVALTSSVKSYKKRNQITRM
jgi:hypothetical protein